MGKDKIVGQTKDVGFQISVRKTFSVSTDTAWNFLFSDGGLKIWLGKISLDEFEFNKNNKTKEGIEGKVCVFKPNSNIRLTWKPKHWTNLSTLQIKGMPDTD
jgi:activator of HSP90 ATPase